MQKRRSSALDAGIRSKNGASPKNPMSSRGSFIILLMVLFFMLPVPSCSPGTSASAVNSLLVGVWESESGNKTFIFFDNGTYAVIYRGWDGGRYSIYDNVLMLVTVEREGGEDETLYTFTVSGNTLTLSDTGDYRGTYRRVKLSLK